MTHDESSARVRRGLSYVCEHLDALREHLTELGRTEELDRLLRAVVDGTEDAATHLETVDRIVRADGDARGAYGAGARTVREPSPLGVGTAAEADVAFLCPLNACARVEWAEPTMRTPPRCRMGDVPLRWVKG
ncbi:hypothetical protein E2C00_19930 [Streptomyces sp. WAC05374]|uniref:DUF948 domain-containing protein n=1 Tax=Streptomyces sp. WAC05374 TaxID=2487420 RepID=UPI000F87ED31|nr:DUF948 domain-containing protein [Streptomyces sp. WAC05374]RST09352.1 hypothetical protein EF905_29485 [Streptomyces sp. WAC05374]TDF40204.1 hypothetical protein E2B92_25280 [Streptomyces sp. WAC05374]TDF53394.1 hypothetical protein E2C00_19930 [Streptomyces sp. WAC05374]TDF59241.1 hypothetical protein E2C02_05410 [Streptomyces sp. WAC05374]